MFLLLPKFLATHSDVPFLTQPRWATLPWKVLSEHPCGTVQPPATLAELSAPGTSAYALALSSGLMLWKWTQPSTYVSTGKGLHSSPGAPCLEHPRQTYSNFCEFSETTVPTWDTRGSNPSEFSSPCSKAATKTTRARLKLAPGYRHSTEIT